MKKILLSFFFSALFFLASCGGAYAFEAPKVGQIVHYTSLQALEEDGSPSAQPAIVTRVRSADGQTSLTIFYPSGLYVKDNVPFSEVAKPGCWHLP